MRLYLDCIQCKETNSYVKEEEYIEEGYYYFECPNGHKNFVVLQEEKFETLFQIGAHAIYDGYYREAISSFTSSLERFYEFCVKVFCKKHNVDIKQIQEACKFYTNSSERQFGSFLFLYLIEFGDVPFKYKDDDKWRNIRNNVIHKGKIPTKEEALQYGDYIRKFILTTILQLQKYYSNELQESIRENMQEKIRHNVENCQITTLCQGNIISIVDGEIEKSLKNDFISEIQSMKRLENGLKMHSNIF